MAQISNYIEDLNLSLESIPEADTGKVSRYIQLLEEAYSVRERMPVDLISSVINQSIQSRSLSLPYPVKAISLEATLTGYSGNDIQTLTLEGSTKPNPVSSDFQPIDSVNGYLPFSSNQSRNFLMSGDALPLLRSIRVRGENLTSSSSIQFLVRGIG